MNKMEQINMIFIVYFRVTLLISFILKYRIFYLRMNSEHRVLMIYLFKYTQLRTRDYFINR